ncbi:helix-turn-helix domain-containing protein [Nonomuraea sp. SYSU D8015]|uniref:AraC-like ligand-binding domain-containing protein n=1 Tax=Nonomuraea sp. SYSU D8015 TaxID=2593644 RepID=UPI0016616162|nr:helix-turn-helix domain-containing protein [Nonomuraea sp. SYSU D8015]
MHRLINLSDLPASDRFAFWQETVARTYMPVDFHSDHAGDFRATMRSLDLGAVHVCGHTYSPLHARRTEKLIRQSDPECYQVTLGMRGTLAVSQDRQDAIVGAGDLMIYHSWKPFHGVVRIPRGTAAAIQLHVPRGLLRLPSRQVDRLCAAQLPARDGVGVLFSQFLTRVAQDAATYRPADAARLGSICIDLLSALLAHQSETGNAVPLESRRRTLLLQIHAHIERSLNDPQLSSGTIAAAHHISVRSLHRLFAEQGTTVSEWIRTRRLEHCRQELIARHSRHRPIHVIAARWGYTDPAAFARAFRTAYGLSPREYRMQQALGQDGRAHHTE